MRPLRNLSGCCNQQQSRGLVLDSRKRHPHHYPHKQQHQHQHLSRRSQPCCASNNSTGNNADPTPGHNQPPPQQQQAAAPQAVAELPAIMDGINWCAAGAHSCMPMSTDTLIAHLWTQQHFQSCVCCVLWECPVSRQAWRGRQWAPGTSPSECCTDSLHPISHPLPHTIINASTLEVVDTCSLQLRPTATMYTLRLGTGWACPPATHHHPLLHLYFSFLFQPVYLRLHITAPFCTHIEWRPFGTAAALAFDFAFCFQSDTSPPTHHHPLGCHALHGLSSRYCYSCLGLLFLTDFSPVGKPICRWPLLLRSCNPDGH